MSSDNYDPRNEIFKVRENFHKSNNEKVSNSLFYWVIGGIGATSIIVITIFSGILNYAFNRVDTIDSRHQGDHDKIIRLETQMEKVKNIK